MLYWCSNGELVFSSLSNEELVFSSSNGELGFSSFSECIHSDQFSFAKEAPQTLFSPYGSNGWKHSPNKSLLLEPDFILDRVEWYSSSEPDFILDRVEWYSSNSDSGIWNVFTFLVGQCCGRGRDAVTRLLFWGTELAGVISKGFSKAINWLVCPWSSSN